MGNKTFSIVTINYNNSEGLKRTLDSVSSQKYCNFEHIVIDGLSTDNSIDVIKCKAHSRLFFISEEDNGISDAFNKGIAQSKGEYILMLNSGDVFYNSDVLDEISVELNRLAISPDVLWGDVISETGFFVGKHYKTKIKPDSIPHQGAFVHRHVYFNKAIYDTSYKIRMDYQFFSELINKKCTFVYVDKTISVYEVDGVSMRNKKMFYLEGMKIDFKYLSISFFGNVLRYIYHTIKEFRAG